MSNCNNQVKDKAVLFHTLTADESMTILKTGRDGLTSDEAAERLKIYGKNELKEKKKKNLIVRFIEQFKNVMVIILLAASFISGFLGEFADMAIILAVIILNAILGVVQESKAEKALEALKSMSKPFARVKRDGEVRKIKSENIVPGDIVLIEAGDFVPADMRLIETANLKIDESALTGESVPVEKVLCAIEKDDLVAGDRKNMAYLSSTVTYGRGTGAVTSTGMGTEVGKIAGYLAEQDFEETPLQKKLAEIGKYLSGVIIAIAAAIFFAGVFQGRDYFDMFLIAVSLAVAAIPEGLPAIVTIVLAIGVRKMAERNAIIRKLPAVETLGSTEIICSDKTGTLTQNKMTVKEIFFNDKLYNEDTFPVMENGAQIFLEVISLCNDSRVSRNADGKMLVLGDPTETALIIYASKKGFHKEELENLLPRKSEIPFDSERKLMTTIHRLDGEKFRVMTKGAPDVLIDRCDRVLEDGKIVPLTSRSKVCIINANRNMASRALRVLAAAFKDIDCMPSCQNSDSVENSLIFIGLAGMIDPPRAEAGEAVSICREAGIRPIMITGDHRDTASAIAKELGIIEDGSEVITGGELDKISEEDFSGLVEKYSVYARVSPEHKIRIVKAWKKKGKTVAMTGDGVNDAPALKASDIGVCMGITGTDVARGVSDMVLSDDNFATIVHAVKEGRKIYANIRKAIQFLLSANIGEVITLFVATMLNWTILFPIHILWINLVTDTLPALALGVEKAESGIMKIKPRKSSGNFFDKGYAMTILYQGFIEAIITLSVYYTGLKLYTPKTAITMAFMTLGLIQLVHSLNVKSNKESLFKTGIFNNMYLIGAITVSALLQISVVLVPFLNGIFRVSALNLAQWLIVLSSSVLIVPAVEVVKFVNTRKGGKID